MKLPPEIKLAIIDNLDKKTLKTCLLLSKEWFELCTRLYCSKLKKDSIPTPIKFHYKNRHINIINNNHHDKLSMYVRGVRELNILNIETLAEWLFIIGVEFNNLADVILSMGLVNEYPKLLDQWLSSPNLKKLELNSEATVQWNIIARQDLNLICPNLQELALKGAPLPKNENTTKFWQSCSKIKKIKTICLFLKQIDVNLLNQVSMCENIEELRLMGYSESGKSIQYTPPTTSQSMIIPTVKEISQLFTQQTKKMLSNLKKLGIGSFSTYNEHLSLAILFESRHVSWLKLEFSIVHVLQAVCIILGEYNYKLTRLVISWKPSKLTKDYELIPLIARNFVSFCQAINSLKQAAKLIETLAININPKSTFPPPSLQELDYQQFENLRRISVSGCLLQDINNNQSTSTEKWQFLKSLASSCKNLEVIGTNLFIPDSSIPDTTSPMFPYVKRVATIHGNCDGSESGCNVDKFLQKHMPRAKVTTKLCPCYEDFAFAAHAIAAQPLFDL